MMAKITLDQLEAGQSALIKSINLNEPEAMRLMEMGLLEEQRVVMVRKAPMGDPIDYKVGETNLSLRKAEAAQVEVER